MYMDGKFDMRMLQVEEAVRRMKTLNLNEDVIKNLGSNAKVQVSCDEEIFDMEDMEKEIVRNFEKEYGYFVYHVVKDKIGERTFYYFLFVSSDMERWSLDNLLLKGNFVNIAFTHLNYNGFHFSNIQIESNNGILKRIIEIK